MGFNQNPFVSPLFKLFGKKLANVPPSPVNMDIIQFNSTSNEWELISGVVGNAVQSSSNVGTGAGVALPRVLDDLPFKTLVDGVEIVITVSPTELAFSIGAIAISKITGLQVILDSKIETITNVGGEKEIALAKVGQNVPLRTLKEGTNITITQNAQDLEISSIDTGEVNTASNVGTGVDVFRLKVLQDLEFRTLLANAEILITQNALDLAFSIGAIAQSKITGLVSALATKLETLTNVGLGVGIAKAKVGTNNDLKSLVAGTDISIVSGTDDITINNTQVPPAQVLTKSAVLLARGDKRTWANQPVALTELFGVTLARILSDFTGFTEARLTVWVNKIANAGATMKLEYDAGAGFLELADVAGVGDILIDVLGQRDSAWFDIDALAGVDDVSIRVVGVGGNGAIDPEFGMIHWEFK